MISIRKFFMKTNNMWSKENYYVKVNIVRLSSIENASQMHLQNVILFTSAETNYVFFQIYIDIYI
jgi:hypothetical protein